jgi:hypothetical protein
MTALKASRSISMTQFDSNNPFTLSGLFHKEDFHSEVNFMVSVMAPSSFLFPEAASAECSKVLTLPTESSIVSVPVTCQEKAQP